MDCHERNGLFVTNIPFKQPKRRLYIWTAPEYRSRHHLGYILLKLQCRNGMKDLQIISWADIVYVQNLLSLFRTYCVCPELIVSVQNLLSLSRTYCLCPEIIVSVQNLVSLSIIYCLCPELIFSVQNLLSLSRTYCLCPELIVCEMCIRLMNNMKFQKDNPRWDLEKFCGRRQKVQDTLEEKLRGFEWKTGNVEILCYNIKKCVLDTMSGLVGKVDR